MTRTAGDVIENYTIDGLEDTILDTLDALHGSLEGLDPDALAAVDEFHIRGRSATVELAELAGDLSGAAVLDIGSGLGGTARYLAAFFGCRVFGIDLTPTYVLLANRLSDLVGLGSATSFREASATEIPFDDEAFDVVWMEHVQMNIEDKSALAAELSRVLRPGGRLAFHEIFEGDGEPLAFPVPWATTAGESFLVTPERFRALLEEAGLEAQTWRDMTEPAGDWLRALAEKLRDGGPPPLGVHLLMGDTAPARFASLAANLGEGRLRVIQGVFRRRVGA
jgi:ubiquinone/menaquinone biosynthesis C-methylase UbiE